jgi:hypothetical protein
LFIDVHQKSSYCHADQTKTKNPGPKATGKIVMVTKGLWENLGIVWTMIRLQVNHSRVDDDRIDYSQQIV